MRFEDLQGAQRVIRAWNGLLVPSIGPKPLFLELSQDNLIGCRSKPFFPQPPQGLRPQPPLAQPPPGLLAAGAKPAPVVAPFLAPPAPLAPKPEVPPAPPAVPEVPPAPAAVPEVPPWKKSRYYKTAPVKQWATFSSSVEPPSTSSSSVEPPTAAFLEEYSQALLEGVPPPPANPAEPDEHPVASSSASTSVEHAAVAGGSQQPWAPTEEDLLCVFKESFLSAYFLHIFLHILFLKNRLCAYV
jgi:hypothetical protein